MQVTHKAPANWVDTEEVGVIQPSQVEGLEHIVVLPTLAELGAAAAVHSHTPGAIGAAAAVHTHTLADSGVERSDNWAMELFDAAFAPIAAGVAYGSVGRYRKFDGLQCVFGRVTVVSDLANGLIVKLPGGAWINQWVLGGAYPSAQMSQAIPAVDWKSYQPAIGSVIRLAQHGSPNASWATVVKAGTYQFAGWLV